MEANMTCTADKAFKAALTKNGKTGPYIMAVSPWQYKDLNNGVASDSWVAYSDTLFAQRLHSIANNEFSPDIIEVLTWNDFCESHYLRDLPSMTNVSATDYVTYSNGMENYVEGMNHAPWRVMAKYYLNWWKNGKAPVITMDQVVYWYRVHPKAAACYGGSSSKIKNYEYPTDAVFAWALVKDKATVSVSVGANQYWEFEADSSGPALSMIPFPKDLGIGGTTPEVSINRNNKVVQYSKGGMAITASCVSSSQHHIPDFQHILTKSTELEQLQRPRRTLRRGCQQGSLVLFLIYDLRSAESTVQLHEISRPAGQTRSHTTTLKEGKKSK